MAAFKRPGDRAASIRVTYDTGEASLRKRLILGIQLLVDVGTTVLIRGGENDLPSRQAYRVMNHNLLIPPLANRYKLFGRAVSEGWVVGPSTVTGPVESAHSLKADSVRRYWRAGTQKTNRGCIEVLQ